MVESPAERLAHVDEAGREARPERIHHLEE